MSVSISHEQGSLNNGDLDYLSITQFTLLHLGCLLVIWTGTSWVAVCTCIFFYCLRIFGLSAGYHRYFSHRAFKTSRVFQFVLAVLGVLAYQKGPLWWSAHHRHHHVASDTDDDVHSPLKRGFWWAHCGWIFSLGNRATNERMVPNLRKQAELRLLDRFYALPPIVLAGSLFLLGTVFEHRVPTLHTSGLQMLAWGFFVSTALVHHGTYSANSFAHIFGSRRFKTRDGSRNNLFVALLTFGDGWHNNHHYYPHSARHGLYWWEIDITHLVLKCLSWIGIVWDLQTPPGRVYKAALVDKVAAPTPSEKLANVESA